MKKYICLLLLFCTAYLSAQNIYRPMLEGSPLWFQDFIGLGEYYTLLIGSAPDTFPNGQIYHRIFSKDLRRAITYPIGYLYEDTTNRKVFYYDRSPNDSLLLSTETLLYDYSLQIGEQVIVPDLDYNRIDTLVLDSINNNIPHSYSLPGNIITHDSAKVFYFTSSNITWGDSTSVWVEGIGSLSGLLNPSVPLYGEESLICVHRYDSLAFQWNWSESDTCDLSLVSIEESLSKNNLQVKMSRLEEQLSLELEKTLSPRAELKIINLNGQVILQRNLAPTGEVIEIELKRYSPGIYYLFILDGSDYYYGSFIK